MSYGYGEWAPYVPVAEKRRLAERAVAKLRKSGKNVAPVTIEGSRIASSFWGRAWCDTIEGFRDYANRLERGRSYVRHGAVVDLQIATGKITAMVSGSELYRTTITIAPTQPATWRAICADCTGRIDSLVELLQGRFSKPVMERLCNQTSGLFPRAPEIKFSCSCPDHASMCKHVAAVLYGIGARFDHAPDLLFRLRGVDETALLADLGTALPGSGAASAENSLGESDLAALFGLDMADAPSPAATPPAAPRNSVAKGRKGSPAAAKPAPLTKPPAAKAAPAKPAVGKAVADMKRKAATTPVQNGRSSRAALAAMPTAAPKSTIGTAKAVAGKPAVRPQPIPSNRARPPFRISRKIAAS